MKNAKRIFRWEDAIQTVKKYGGTIPLPWIFGPYGRIIPTDYNKLLPLLDCSIVTTTKKMTNVELYNENCLEALPKLKDASIDLVMTDLPYGTTACKWDSIIPLDKLWEQLLRVGKPNTTYVFTCQQPFTWVLAASNPKMLKYELIWEKPNGTSPYHAKNMPMKKHENVLVFYKEKPTYNPQMVAGKPYKWNTNRSGGEAGGISQTKETPIDNKGTRFPGSILRFPQERGLHPTQKPVALMEWIVNSYSNKGDAVLDCTMGSGTTGVAAVNCGRNFVGIELNKKYFDIAEGRITERHHTLELYNKICPE